MFSCSHLAYSQEDMYWSGACGMADGSLWIYPEQDDSFQNLEHSPGLGHSAFRCIDILLLWMIGSEAQAYAVEFGWFIDYIISTTCLLNLQNGLAPYEVPEQKRKSKLLCVRCLTLLFPCCVQWSRIMYLRTPGLCTSSPLRNVRPRAVISEIRSTGRMQYICCYSWSHTCSSAVEPRSGEHIFTHKA